jgi:hypothetical protein
MGRRWLIFLMSGGIRFRGIALRKGVRKISTTPSDLTEKKKEGGYE